MNPPRRKRRGIPLRTGQVLLVTSFPAPKGRGIPAAKIKTRDWKAS